MKIATLFFTLFLISCNSNSQKTDAENAMSDKDSVAVIDSDTQDEVPDESDDPDAALPDSDSSVPDTAVNDDEFIDDCDVKLIDAKFPYYDKDSNITFCRPGCDTPTEKDPQCMTNLWREQNHNLCHQYPEYDCCGYPCVLDSLMPLTKEEEEKWGQYAIPMHKCDLKLNPENWGNDGTHGVVKSWNMSDGKVGFYIYTNNLSVKDWSVQTKHVTYDIATKKFNFILPARGQMQAYYKGSRIALVSDKRSLELNNSNIFLSYIRDDGSSHLAYNKPVNFLAYEPALNDTWAFVNLQETETAQYKMMYAKVGEWKWTVLGEGTVRYSELGGNYLGLYDENKNGYICDLSKNPKLFSDCIKVNRNEEGVSIIVFNKNNPEEFIYNSNGYGIVLAKLVQGKLEYSDLVTDFTDETKSNAYTLSPYSFRDNIVLYAEITYKDSETGSRICYYNIDTKKKFCMKKMDKDETYSDGTTKFRYGFSEFEGKWFLYQRLNSTPLVLRDMDCYCKEEGICPFEE
ncbi:MAG TPA: hypothetical protein PLW37_14920 [bacterium]|nr:hypothetical protein [bacterium]